MKFFSWSLPVGQWKWWYIPLAFVLMMVVVSIPQQLGVMVAGLFSHPNPTSFVADYGQAFDLLKFALMVILSMLLMWVLAWKIPTREDFGLGIVNLQKTVIATILGFVLYTVAVYLFERYTPGAKDAGPEVAKSLGMGISATKDILVVLMVTVFAPVGEEFIYRGLLFRSTRDGIANLSFLKKLTPTAIVIISTLLSAYLFAMAHGGEGQDLQIYMIGLLGVITSLAYVWSGSLYAPIMIHALNNALALYQALISPGFPAFDRPMIFFLLAIAPIVVIVITYLIQILLPSSLGQKHNS